MTTTHRIAINENPRLQCSTHVRAQRVSKTRCYGACVVATATARTIELAVTDLAHHEAEIERLRLLVASTHAAALGGLSFEDAEKAHEKLTRAWFKPLLTNEDKLRAPRPSYGLSDAQRARAIEMTEAEGFINPYTQPFWTFLEHTRILKGHEYRARYIREQNLQAGQQMVLSWHRDAALAQKGIASQTHYIARGFELTVRTDIEITTK